VLVRSGGEEFLVIAPHTSAIDGLKMAEKIRHAVEQTAIPGCDHVTVSLGVAQLGEQESADSLTQRVDAAMARAKRAGRNCVELAMQCRDAGLGEGVPPHPCAWLAGDLGCGRYQRRVVAMMMIPQGMAYALVAGLPPVAGIYASIVPPLLYALFGTSSSQSVGPMAIISLMTASVLAPLAAARQRAVRGAGGQLALLSGLVLLACGLLRIGFLANFFSRPVMNGFTIGSAILIALDQLGTLLGCAAGQLALPSADPRAWPRWRCCSLARSHWRAPLLRAAACRRRGRHRRQARADAAGAGARSRWWRARARSAGRADDRRGAGRPARHLNLATSARTGRRWPAGAADRLHVSS
jgi:hypothetical protein